MSQSPENVSELNQLPGTLTHTRDFLRVRYFIQIRRIIVPNSLQQKAEEITHKLKNDMNNVKQENAVQKLFIVYLVDPLVIPKFYFF